jgi:methyl coenzyme M reductase subunit D
MVKKDNYRIKVKSGRNLIEIEGDKKFVNSVFQDIKEIFPKGSFLSFPIQGKKLSHFHGFKAILL